MLWIWGMCTKCLVRTPYATWALRKKWQDNKSLETYLPNYTSSHPSRREYRILFLLLLWETKLKNTNRTTARINCWGHMSRYGHAMRSAPRLRCFATVSRRRPPPWCNVLAFNRLIWLVKNHPIEVTEDNHNLEAAYLYRCCMSQARGRGSIFRQRGWTPRMSSSTVVSFTTATSRSTGVLEKLTVIQLDDEFREFSGARSSITVKIRPASTGMTLRSPTFRRSVLPPSTGSNSLAIFLFRSLK
jgi:hypothetical protein